MSKLISKYLYFELDRLMVCLVVIGTVLVTISIFQLIDQFLNGTSVDLNPKISDLNQKVDLNQINPI